MWLNVFDVFNCSYSFAEFIRQQTLGKRRSQGKLRVRDGHLHEPKAQDKSQLTLRLLSG